MREIGSFGQRTQWFLIPAAIAVFAILLRKVTTAAILDPLFIALAIGILLRSGLRLNEESAKRIRLAPTILIPPGVILYGAVNLNFSKLTPLDPNYIFLIFIVFLVYTLSTLVLAKLFGLNERSGYLITTGSTICGASAIAITSRAIDADPDDISVSLISVFSAALIGLFLILPVTREALSLTDIEYGVFSGTVLQFTGFVKSAAAHLSAPAQNIAISVKALRYIGLLFLIPLFASLIKGKLYIPMILWGFLGAGLVCTFLPQIMDVVRPAFKTALTILWSMAMAAIGLNADMKKVFSKTGVKAVTVSFLSFMISGAVFLGGMLILK